MDKKLQAITKNFDQPDETRPFRGHGRLDVINLDEKFMVGRGVFDPGWKWSNDVKPIAETESCDVEHLGYCISGSMVVRMNDGQEVRISAGQVFHLPPGHDAWVEGDQPCELIDFSGFSEYALEKSKRKVA